MQNIPRRCSIWSRVAFPHQSLDAAHRGVGKCTGKVRPATFIQRHSQQINNSAAVSRLMQVLKYMQLVLHLAQKYGPATVPSADRANGFGWRQGADVAFD
jgi:hypothetical protein